MVRGGGGRIARSPLISMQLFGSLVMTFRGLVEARRGVEQAPGGSHLWGLGDGVHWVVHALNRGPRTAPIKSPVGL